MAFVVEDGTIVAGATSYVTVAEADAYFADLNDPQDWSTLTAGVKQTRLMIGTKFVDDLYRGAWKGRVISKEQDLAWPRSGVVDEELNWITSTEIPQRLKDATCEAAVLSIAGTALYPTVNPRGPERRVEIDKGVMQEWFKDFSGLREAYYTSITRLLKGLVGASPGTNITMIQKFRG